MRLRSRQTRGPLCPSPPPPLSTTSHSPHPQTALCKASRAARADLPGGSRRRAARASAGSRCTSGARRPRPRSTRGESSANGSAPLCLAPPAAGPWLLTSQWIQCHRQVSGSDVTGSTCAPCIPPNRHALSLSALRAACRERQERRHRHRNHGDHDDDGFARVRSRPMPWRGVLRGGLSLEPLPPREPSPQRGRPRRSHASRHSRHSRHSRRDPGSHSPARHSREGSPLRSPGRTRRRKGHHGHPHEHAYGSPALGQRSPGRHVSPTRASQRVSRVPSSEVGGSSPLARCNPSTPATQAGPGAPAAVGCGPARF